MTKLVIYFQLSFIIIFIDRSYTTIEAQTLPQPTADQELLSLYEQGLDSIIIQQYSSPSNEAEYYYLASSYLRLGDYNQSLIYFSELTDTKNTDEPSWWNTEARIAKAKLLFYLR